MLLEFFPRDHELQICLCTKHSASVPICLKYTEFKTREFFLFRNSFYLVLQRVQQTALVECSQLLLRSKHFCLSFQSQSGEWSRWQGARFRETLNSTIFHMQEWLGRCRLTIFTKIYSHMKIHSNVILCEAMISCQHPALDHSTLLLCAGSSSLCCFQHLFSKKHPFLPCKSEADPFLGCRSPFLLCRTWDG